MNANTSSSTVVNFRKEGEEDRISNLPDDVLQHILCFLPTIDVVATSVLSTRWKYLWTATGSLHFCNEMIRNVKMINYPMCNMKLMNIVEKILLLHDAPFIRRFSFYSSTTLDESRVNSWISAVIKRKVEEIILNILVEHSHLLHLGSLLSCESLKIFKFKGPSFFKLPSSSVFFSNLKVLHLFFIQVSGDEAIQNVSLNFPMLDEVVLDYCEWLNLKIVNIFAPALKRLTIAHDDHHSSDDYYDDCKIKIYAENLITLDFRTTLAYDISLHNLSSLYKACIYIWSEDHLPHRMIKFLKGMYHVTDLTLFDGTICSLYSKHLILYPMFCNLKILRIDVEEVDSLDGGRLLYLFSNLPNIESLFFPNGLKWTGVARLWKEETVPQPILSHLNSVEFSVFSGNEDELGLVEFLLKNARALEKMTITISSDSKADPQQQIEVMKQLLMLPRSSPACVVCFP